MTELKPCPFCGGEAVVTFEADGIRSVECAECHALVDDIEAWNTRAADIQEFEFHVKESERGRCYLNVTNHLRKASIANLRNDEDAEREEVEAAHDLLSEVMGR